MKQIADSLIIDVDTSSTHRSAYRRLRQRRAVSASTHRAVPPLRLLIFNGQTARAGVRYFASSAASVAPGVRRALLCLVPGRTSDAEEVSIPPERRAYGPPIRLKNGRARPSACRGVNNPQPKLRVA